MSTPVFCSETHEQSCTKLQGANKEINHGDEVCASHWQEICQWEDEEYISDC